MMLNEHRQRPSHFHWADYLIFILTTLLSASVGVYYGIRDKRQKRNTLEDYLFAGRKMNIFPISFSLFVSYLSAISFLGDPVEVYLNGAIYWILTVGSFIGFFPVAFYFAPKYQQMKLYSAFEFLETRYNPAIRVLGSVSHGLAEVLYCGVVLYAPSLALSQVSGLEVWMSILIAGIVCTFYTTLGGIKAVLWADTIQMGIMFVGLVAVVIRGSIVVGGFGRMWSIAEARGRINFNNFNPNPFVRVTFWTNLFGGFFRTFSPYTFKQKFVQRYCSVSSSKEAKLAVLLNIPMSVVFSSLFVFMGLVMVAYYDGCDPLLEGRIQVRDQIVPLVIVDLLGFIPGFPGLFLASLFCASLSSMSSIQNSLAITLLKDVVEPLYERKARRKVTPGLSLTLSKLFSVLIGLVIIVLALVLMNLKDASIFEITAKITGSFAAPVAALFAVGLLFPFVNSCGCIIGVVVGSGICIWWNLGSVLTGVIHDTLRLFDESCPALNVTEANWTILEFSTVTEQGTWTSDIPIIEGNSGFSVSTLYHLSPILFNGVGYVLTVVTSLAIGGITALVSKKKTSKRPLAEQIDMDDCGSTL